MLEGVERGGELLFVEGQGSLLHPAYSGVTLGLLHGSAPHAYVLCHLAGRAFVDDDARFPIPPLSELVALHERAEPDRPPGAASSRSRSTPGTSTTTPPARAIEAAEAETGLPADDPVRFGGASCWTRFGGLTTRSRFRQHSLTVP